MNGNFDVVIYTKKKTNYTRKKTDLVNIEFDAGNYNPASNMIQVSAGEFKLEDSSKLEYKYYDNQLITIYQDNKKIFEGSFEQLCEKINKLNEKARNK